MENFETVLKRELIIVEERLEKRLEKKLGETLERKLEEKLDKKLNERFEKELKPIKDDIKEMKKTLFLIEHEQGRKIDVMYDFIMLEKEKREQQALHINNIDARVDKTEGRIFEHENRIVVLEENLNSNI